MPVAGGRKFLFKRDDFLESCSLKLESNLS